MNGCNIIFFIVNDMLNRNVKATRIRFTDMLSVMINLNLGTLQRVTQ